MKKIFAFPLIAVLLLLAACGSQPDNTLPPSPSPSPEATLPPEPEVQSGLSVEIKNESSRRTVDGVQIVSSSFDYPVITVTGKDTPAAEDLKAWADNFYLDSLERSNDLINEAETFYSDVPQYFTESFYYLQTLEPVYESEKMTVLYCYSEYSMGGTHPQHNQSAVNLNMELGVPLTLADIGDAEAIVAAASENILTQINEQGLSDQLFENYADFVSEGIVDGSWYLTEDGFSVIYTEYYLAPYAYGTFNFTVPFSALDGCIKPEYALN